MDHPSSSIRQRIQGWLTVLDDGNPKDLANLRHTLQAGTWREVFETGRVPRASGDRMTELVASAAAQLRAGLLIEAKASLEEALRLWS